MRSARFAGEDATDADNLALLIERAPPGSALAYVCVIALRRSAHRRGAPVRGPLHGHDGAAPRGSGGFGYDPVFVPDDRDDGRTMAELAPAEKDAISHRGRAARALRDHLREPAPASR